MGRLLKGTLTNPLPSAIGLGLLVSALEVRLPGPIDTIVRMLADAATPVALFTIGTVLWRAGQHVHNRTPVRQFLPLALAKLIVHPLVVMALGVAAIKLGAAARLVDTDGARAGRSAAVGQRSFTARRALRRRQWPHHARDHQFDRHGIRQFFRAGMGVRGAAPLNAAPATIRCDASITELRLPLDHHEAALRAAIVERLRVSDARLCRSPCSGARSMHAESRRRC